MSVFEDVEIRWGDKDYKVPSHRVMGMIEKIEDHVTFGDLNTNKPPLGKIAAAFAEALRYAGANVSSEEVYSGMFEGATTGQILMAITGLQMIMIPPAHVQKKTKGGTEADAQTPEKGRKRRKAS